jgi:thiamine pyrophosphate-dependent acetolactate synthase large subunit-like protein
VLTTGQVLEPLARLRTGEIVVTTMSVVRPWGRLSSHALDFASADSAMGHAADFALGIAIAQPDRRVLCLNGDGSMLMTLGTLVSAAAAGATNLVLFIIDNGTYEITGNQTVPGGGTVDYAAMARAAGFPETSSFDDPKEYEAALPKILAIAGPVLVSLRVEPGGEGPISRNASEEARYLQVSLERSAHQLRRDLAEA